MAKTSPQQQPVEVGREITIPVWRLHVPVVFRAPPLWVDAPVSGHGAHDASYAQRLDCCHYPLLDRTHPIQGSMTHTSSNPVIGLVGSQGHYGRWLRRFFETRMQLTVLGSDQGQPDTCTPEQLLQRCQVLVFCTPIRHTPKIIEDYVALAGGRERDALWLDITSVKHQPVAAMLRSQAEVVGLHPMTAAPKAPTLKGRVLVVCEARLVHWRGWFESFMAALRAQCVHATPEKHDQIMALVQALVHAGHLAQASVLEDLGGRLGGLAALLPFRSAAFELDTAIISRMLAMNPAIYEDIQFGNPHVLPVLDALVRQITGLRDWVAQGDDAARQHFRAQYFGTVSAAIGAETVAAGNYTFERVGYLLADLAGERSLSVYLPEDHPGSLRALLHCFERHGINIASIHSSRTPVGELHFRMGFDDEVTAVTITPVIEAIHAEGIGRLVELSEDLRRGPPR